ncbi:putative translation initiation factor eIF3 subunit [Chytridium lagenaria]|nr:putative translation initiation factor eIF3 subunit [Chytridium lagenaria]
MPSAAARWGDEVDEGEEILTTAPISQLNPDGTKTVIDYRINDDGKRVKVTSRIRTNVVVTSVNPSVARRKLLHKFGDSKNLPAGIDSDSTSFGEKQTVKFSYGRKLDVGQPGQDENKSMKEKLGNAKIMCRICKGDHWTSKCPFKDSHVPLEPVEKFVEEPPASSSGGLGSGGKYVPPSMRAGGNSKGSAPPGAPGQRNRDDFFTLRITNLSEDATEQDIKDLVSRFGHTSRVFVARDHETNMCKGFAFVSFYSKDDAERAMAQLHGRGYDNLILHVELAKNKERE